MALTKTLYSTSEALSFSSYSTKNLTKSLHFPLYQVKPTLDRMVSRVVRMDTTTTVQQVVQMVKATQVVRHHLNKVSPMLVLQILVEPPHQQEVKLAIHVTIQQPALPTVHHKIIQAVQLKLAVIPMLIQRILLAILLQETIFHPLKIKQAIQATNPHRAIN